MNEKQGTIDRRFDFNPPPFSPLCTIFRDVLHFVQVVCNYTNIPYLSEGSASGGNSAVVARKVVSIWYQIAESLTYLEALSGIHGKIAIAHKSLTE